MSRFLICSIIICAVYAIFYKILTIRLGQLSIVFRECPMVLVCAADAFDPRQQLGDPGVDAGILFFATAFSPRDNPDL